MKKALLLLSVMSFLLFRSLLSGKEFQARASIGSQALLLCLLLFSFSHPLLGYQISLPTSTVLLGIPREFPFQLFIPFFFQVLLHLLQIAFHNDVVHLGEPT